MFARTTKLQLANGLILKKKRTVCLPVERRQHPHILNNPPDNYMVKALWPQSQVRHPSHTLKMRYKNDMELYLLFGDEICLTTAVLNKVSNLSVWPLIVFVCGHNSCGQLVWKQHKHRTNDVQTHRDLSCLVGGFNPIWKMLVKLDHLPR